MNRKAIQEAERYKVCQARAGSITMSKGLYNRDAIITNLLSVMHELDVSVAKISLLTFNSFWNSLSAKAAE